MIHFSGFLCCPLLTRTPEKCDDICQCVPISRAFNAHLYSWIFTNINQVVEMLKATADQQLASTNLQPTNLFFNHNTVNSGMATTGNRLE